MRHGSCSTVQAFVLCARHRNLRSASSPADGWCLMTAMATGWFITSRTLLDARLFQSPPKVAGYKEWCCQTKRQTGQVAEEKTCKGEMGRARLWRMARSRHWLKVVVTVAFSVAQRGKRMKTSAFVGISKQTRQTISLEMSPRPQECRAGRKAGAMAAGGGGGGSGPETGCFKSHDQTHRDLRVVRVATQSVTHLQSLRLRPRHPPPHVPAVPTPPLRCSNCWQRRDDQCCCTIGVGIPGLPSAAARPRGDGRSSPTCTPRCPGFEPRQCG